MVNGIYKLQKLRLNSVLIVFAIVLKNKDTISNFNNADIAGNFSSCQIGHY